MLAYSVTLTPDDNNTLLVRCPDLPEVVTFGENQAEALGYAEGAIEEALAARMAHREEIPLPKQDKGGNLHPVRLTAQMEIAVEVYHVLLKAPAAVRVYPGQAQEVEMEKTVKASVDNHEAVVRKLREDPEFALEYLKTTLAEEDEAAFNQALLRVAQAYGVRPQE